MHGFSKAVIVSFRCWTEWMRLLAEMLFNVIDTHSKNSPAFAPVRLTIFHLRTGMFTFTNFSRLNHK